ncbi:MAG: cytochrome P450 [Acidimicrobiales bacterium]
MTEAQMESVRDMEPAPYIRDMQQLTDHAECEEVLKSKDFIQGSHRESAAFFAESLIMLDGEPHFERRRLESVLFTKAALEHYERRALDPHIDQVIAEAAANNRGDDGVVRGDLCQMLREMLARISATITGIDGVDDPEATARFRWFLEQLGTGVTVEWSTEDHDAVISRILGVRDLFVEEFFGPSLERRRDLVARHEAGELDEGDLPTDLLTLMLANWNPDWDPEVPLREATLFLVAATQTTTHTGPHVIRHLDEWLADNPGDREHLEDPEFLKKAAYEALRLHLPAPALLRQAVRDVELSTGRRVAEGERVACMFTPANRDEKVFGDTFRSFDPHRDTGSAKPWGLAFGGGEHMCIGRALVTGLSARTDGTEGTDGTIVRILRALFRAGVKVDPDDSPAYTEASHHDAYERFPVVFTNL